jgi:hypothetical protein
MNELSVLPEGIEKIKSVPFANSSRIRPGPGFYQIIKKTT